MDSEAIFVVPGLDSTLVMDNTVTQAESVFHQAFSFARRRSQETATNEGESITTANTSTFISLDAHWDGIFPPRPPRPEDLVFMQGSDQDGSGTATGTEDFFTTTPGSGRPTLLPSGNGDWSVAAMDNTIGESEFTTVMDP